MSTPFVYFSSLDVYGLSTAPLISEATPLDESYNNYARGEVVSERLLTEAVHAQGRSDSSILRAPHIWAPHPTARKRLDALAEGHTMLLPGADEAEWLRYRAVVIGINACGDDIPPRPASSSTNVFRLTQNRV